MVEKRQIACIALGIGAAVLTFFVDNSSVPIQDGHVLERGSYGQGEREQQILVEGLGEHAVPVDLVIGERQYDKAEAEAAMEAAAEQLPQQILGGNESLFQVRSRLELPGWLEEYGIAVRWEPENRELIGTDGEVYGDTCPDAGVETGLTAVLSAGAYSREYYFPVTVLPPARTAEEKRLEQFSKVLRQMDESQQQSEYLILPETYEGTPLRYRTERNRDFLLFPLLGFLAACLLPLLEKQREQERRRERERQMMLDYPGIVSKLLVFTGAGLPVRGAWEQVVLEYEKDSAASRRAAYEEMAGVFHRMQRGLPEREAYMEFGNRCGLLSYRKLATLLEQNVRKGSDHLRPLLEAEMEDAFEQRKNLARRMGEEASTKLLVPLFLLLMIVMVMVSMPAFLSFGI